MLGSSFTGNIPSISRQEFEAEIQALSLCVVEVFGVVCVVVVFVAVVGVVMGVMHFVPK